MTGAGTDLGRVAIESFLRVPGPRRRAESTILAYLSDLDDFARYCGVDRAGAVANLLSGGFQHADEVFYNYISYLRKRGRALNTITRRLTTLSGVVRAAQIAGLIDWHLEPPSDIEISKLMGETLSGSEHYTLFPRAHPSEIDRLDILHFAIRAVQRANFLAPITAPSRVLDVGSGTGQWGWEMSERFPKAVVVGLDLVPGKPRRPPGYREVKANLLHGLPFQDGEFDYVHQRTMVAAIPLAAWPDVVADLVRVTRPGGWVELGDVPWEFENAGPATARMEELTGQMAGRGGLDAHRTVFDSLDDYLRGAGLEQVTRRQISVPVGRGNPPREGEEGHIGSMMATDFRAGAERVCEAFTARGIITPDEARRLVAEGYQECDSRRMAQPFASAWGRKPG